MCRHLQTAIKGTSETLLHTPQVKICGITSVQDAKLAASAGADMLGMIMWQKAKRAVSASVARDIASVAEDHGIQSVGVFVDENAQHIQDMCGESGVQVAQLHGKGARQALCQLPENLHVVYVMNSDDHGIIQTPSPAELAEQIEQVLSRCSYVHVSFVLTSPMMSICSSRGTFDIDMFRVPTLVLFTAVDGRFVHHMLVVQACAVAVD